MKVFVYGTLKPGESNYQLYCSEQVIAAQKAYTFGQLFQLSPGYPGMGHGEDKVKGYLLTFSNERVLEKLDRLEDYLPQRSPTENEYYRQKIPVYNLSGEPLGQAWGYLMTAEKISEYQGKPIPSGCWSSKS